MSHQFHPSILREYDVRGIVGETITETDAYHLARAFAAHIRAKEKGNAVCLGYDGRLSSPKLEETACKGFQESGFEVWRIGRGPTPMLYFAVRHFKAAAGMMITGSHNPPTHNGFKMMLSKESVYGDAVKALGHIASTGAYVHGTGSNKQVEVRELYLEALLKAYDGTKPLKAAWDAGNGAAGEIMAELCKRLPGTHATLYETIDGTFPNHHPDPTVAENLEDIIKVVRNEGCDLGLAFDGDGDRLGVVDNEGGIIWGDQILAILAEDILKTLPGSAIIADVKASQTLFDGIAAQGGTPVMWKSGHSLIKAKMAETNAPLGGEMSGHIFFADKYFGFDDGLYAAVRMLGIASRSPKSLAEIRKALPQTFSTPEWRFDCPEERKFAIIDEVKNRLKAAGGEVNDIDGVRVKTSDGWWLLRASNTQAVLVARCESTNEAGLQKLIAALKQQLSLSSVTLPKELAASFQA